jgi:NRPS condensation-like uncharacterized protein
MDTLVTMAPTTQHIELPDGDFSDYEQVYVKMSRAFSHINKEHWGIHCVCSIKHDAPSGTEIRTAIKTAWMHLMVEYPGLGMVSDGLRKRYSRLDEASISFWAQKTFFITDQLSSDDLVAESSIRDLPSLHYLPASSELVLLIQHWRTDGLGACMLLDRLFEIMAKASTYPNAMEQFDPEIRSPSLESAAGASLVDDADLKAYARKYIDNFHMKAVNAGGLPFRGDAQTPPSRATHNDLEFSTDLTRDIVSVCKNHQISVSAAIHAALARTVFSYLAEPDCQAGYTTIMAINMRPHLPPPYNSKTHACQTYVASITPTVDYSHSFLEAARCLTFDYRNWWNEKFMRSLSWIYKYHLAKLSALRPVTTVPAKPPSGVTLSSLGVVEKHLSGDYGPNFSVEKFRFGVSMMTRQMILYAWTFKGRLTLSLSYNEAYYSEEMVKGVISRVASSLAEGLQLQL